MAAETLHRLCRIHLQGELTAYDQQERHMGIEPTNPAWKAGMLPLHQWRMLTKDGINRYSLSGRKDYSSTPPTHGGIRKKGELQMNVLYFISAVVEYMA